MQSSALKVEQEMHKDVALPTEKSKNNKPIGQRLLESGQISEPQLDLALREQKRQDKRLGEILVDLGFISPEVLTSSLATENKTEVVNVVNTSIDPEALELVSYDIAKEYKLIPLQIDGEILTIALADVFNVVAIDLIERETGKTVKVVSAHSKDILEALERNYSHGQSINETIDLLLEQGITPTEVDIEGGSPMVRMVDQIISHGVKKNATDIHIEPDEKVLRVRYRVDGMLYQDVLIPLDLRAALTARLKLIAGMNISERRIPQDGRIHFVYGSSNIDLRVSTLPTNHGESIVMRILDSGSVSLSLDAMGFSQKDNETYVELMHQSFGMVLVTGPTGSGKTTTLYTALGLIDKENRSVFTLEDPIEYSMPMIRQTPIRADVGMDFSAGLKALLRQDPDVILIGEIRDLETAELSIRAALTGHLLLSTLHTNSAAGVIPRLIDMGVESYMLPAALNAAIGQRLVRRICEYCKQEHENPAAVIETYHLESHFDDKVTLYEGAGCDHCNQSGYKGRQAIYEILVVGESLHDPILHGASVLEIEKIACQNGMKTMLDDGLIKAAQGTTSIDEIIRVVR